MIILLFYLYTEIIIFKKLYTEKALITLTNNIIINIPIYFLIKFMLKSLKLQAIKIKIKSIN